MYHLILYLRNDEKTFSGHISVPAAGGTISTGKGCERYFVQTKDCIGRGSSS